MDKSYADKIAAEYMEKIFGFALSKTMNTDKAEELASRIIFDVYTSLLKNKEVHNISGYIYRVSCNVYARFVDEEVRGRYISLDEVSFPILCENDFTLDFEKHEDYIRLRREVSYLGRIQREIVVLHYFQRLKQNEIAERLNIPLGTVKWHLHDARNQIKTKLTEGSKMREKINLGMKPVELNVGMSGRTSPDGKGPHNYFTKLISQNIAYAAYHEPKTIIEIAEELGVSAAFIEDEISFLEEMGFIDRVNGNKYQTNIFIRERSGERWEELHKLYKKYAKIIRDKYIPSVFDAMKDYKSKKIYVPKDDFNFLMYSAVAYAIRYMLYFKKDMDLHSSKYYIKRKDGSEYVALGWIIKDFKVNFDMDKYNVPNNMTEGSEHTYSWQITSYYDSRSNTYNDFKGEDHEYLYEYITGKISKTPEHADKFKILFDKNYLVAEEDSEYVNIIVADNPESNPTRYFVSLLPAPPEDFKILSEEFDKEVQRADAYHCPEHMRELHRLCNSNCLCDQNLIAYVFELLLKDGTLKPLTETQKKSVNTIMFCDTLPK
jgi:RNA polymerase sigma factor (sigma-70 family)